MKKAQRVRKYLAVLLCAALMLTSIPITALATILDEYGGWKVDKLVIQNEQGNSIEKTDIKVGETRVFTVVLEDSGLIPATPSEATPSVAKASAADAIRESLLLEKKNVEYVPDGGGSEDEFVEWGFPTSSSVDSIIMDGNSVPDELKPNQFSVKGIKAGSGKLIVKDDNGETKAELRITIKNDELNKLTLEPSSITIKKGDSCEVAITLGFNKSVVEDVSSAFNKYWNDDSIWEYFDEGTKERLDKEKKISKNGVASWSWNTEQKPDSTTSTGYIKITGKEVGETSIRIVCDGIGAALSIVVTSPEEPLVSEIEVNPQEVTIDMSSETPAETVTITPKFINEAQGASEKRRQLQKFGRSLRFILSPSGVVEAPSIHVDYAAGTIELSVKGLSRGDTTITISDENHSFDEKSVKVHVLPPTETVVVSAVETAEADSSVMSTLVSLTGDNSELSEAAEDIVNALEGASIIDNLSTNLKNYLKEQVGGKEIDTVQIAPKVKINGIEADVVANKLVVNKVNLDLDIKVMVYGPDGNEEIGKEIEKDLKTKMLKEDSYYIPITVSLPGAEARGGNNRAEWTHYSDDNRTSTDNSVFVGGRMTTIYDDEDAASSFTTVTVKSFSPFSIVFKTDNGDNPPRGSSGGSGGSSSASVGKWVQNEKGWWYQNPNGSWPSNGWAQLTWNGVTSWYYFNAEGYMVTGWITDGGLRYYLHPVSDGTMGHMYTGWHLIDGKYYYFSEVSDGTKGHLLVNTTTPDGYQVGADGVWIQ